MKTDIFNLDLNLYKVFCAVAECKSISNAAEKLFVTQQAVSHNIKKLEEELGAKLFIRIPRGVEITPEAEKLYNTIKSSINGIAVGLDSFNEDKTLNSGEIRIGVNSIIYETCLCNYIENFHKGYPNIKYKIFSNSAIELLNMLKNHDIDMVVSTASSENIENAFSRKSIDKLDFAFVGNEKYKTLAKEEDISLKELAKHPLLLFNKRSEIRAYLNKCFENSDIVLKPVMEFTHYEPLITSIKKGMGIGYVIENAVREEIASKNLFKIPVKEVSHSKDVSIIYNEDYLSIASKTFILM
ncbi:LysR family transcriptional regulator [Clostridia bacterium]|nr:LysR family transcriptional regulator [Clostridia bacterium]